MILIVGVSGLEHKRSAFCHHRPILTVLFCCRKSPGLLFLQGDSPSSEVMCSQDSQNLQTRCLLSLLTFFPQHLHAESVVSSALVKLDCKITCMGVTRWTMESFSSATAANEVICRLENWSGTNAKRTWDCTDTRVRFATKASRTEADSWDIWSHTAQKRNFTVKFVTGHLLTSRPWRITWLGNILPTPEQNSKQSWFQLCLRSLTGTGRRDCLDGGVNFFVPKKSQSVQMYQPPIFRLRE